MGLRDRIRYAQRVNRERNAVLSQAVARRVAKFAVHEALERIDAIADSEIVGLEEIRKTLKQLEVDCSVIIWDTR